ncbi:MAG: hypothetical protein O3A20_10620 [Planctomycetota bacterium]|nr:hypothetical protein [Planctomycetota bacterium]
MASELNPDELSHELIAALRSLGGERAPAALADGVELARLPQVSAPPELWARVSAELRKDSPEQRTRLMAWPRWAAAASILLLAGLAWFGGAELLGTKRGLGIEEFGLAQAVPAETRRMLIARLVVREVPPEKLSPLTRSFMMGSMAPMRDDG